MNTPKCKFTVVIAILLAGANVNTFAAHGGGGPMGGMSSGHISARGISNTNGPASLDRDKGLARAEDRRNSNAVAHEKAAHRAKHRHHREL